jgi:hypothetical protein
MASFPFVEPAPLSFIVITMQSPSVFRIQEMVLGNWQSKSASRNGMGRAATSAVLLLCPPHQQKRRSKRRYDVEELAFTSPKSVGVAALCPRDFGGVYTVGR